MDLKLTGVYDGDIDLNSNTVPGVSIRGAGWAPVIAPIRDSWLGNQPYHEDVVEVIQLRADGTSASECLGYVKAIKKAMDQARHWDESGGLGVTAVLLEYKPNGSNLTENLKAAVLKTEGNNFSLTPQQDKNLNNWFVEFDLRIKRRGDLLGIEETAGSSATDNTDVIEVDFGTNQSGAFAYNDIKVASNAIIGSGDGDWSSGMLLYTSTKGGIVVAGAVSGSQSVAETDAYGGVVNHITAASDGINYNSTAFGTTDGYIPAGLYSVALVVEGVAGISWTISPYFESRLKYHMKPTTFVCSGDKEVVQLGIISIPHRADKFEFLVNAVDTTAGSYSLKIERRVISAVGKHSGIIPFNAVDAELIGSVTANQTVHIKHNLTERKGPSTRYYDDIYTDGDFDEIIVEGDLITTSSGRYMDFYYLSVAGDAWAWFSTGSTETQLTITVTRRPAYTAPI